MVTDFQEHMTSQMAALTPIIEKIIGHKMEFAWRHLPGGLRGELFYFMEEKQVGRTRYRPRQWVSYFDVRELGGNGYVMESCGVNIWPDFHNRGLGGLLHAARLAAAKAAGVKLMICTVNNTNEPELKILRKNGWSEGVNFGTASLWTKLI